MDVNIQKYLAFVKTVECGSFTNAAEILSYSQSGISRMINDLEKEWNVSLLERGKGGVKLTSDGLKLLPYAQNVCNEYLKLQMQVSELNGLHSGLIRIGTFSSVATHWLPKVIKKFQSDYPGIDYELLLGDYTEIENWILEGRVDCGFLRLPANAELETSFLEQDKLLVVLPETHPLADCDRFPVNALCDYPFMLLEKGAKAEISEIFEKCNLAPKIHFTTWDKIVNCQWQKEVEKSLSLTEDSSDRKENKNSEQPAWNDISSYLEKLKSGIEKKALCGFFQLPVRH